MQELSLQIYEVAAKRTEQVGIILVDTKFEFGTDVENVVLADEVLTPDSSRFWERKSRERNPGRQQASLDKQCLRDWLCMNGLNGKKGVSIPKDMTRRIASRYHEACERISGASMI